MKTCKRCFREFDEEDVLDVNASPAIGWLISCSGILALKILMTCVLNAGKNWV